MLHVVTSMLKQSPTLEASKELQSLITELEKSAQGTISYHVTFDFETTKAMLTYQKDKKLGRKVQSLIRVAVIKMLKKEGYL